MSSPPPGPLLLALHSSSDTLGVAAQTLALEPEPARLAAFPLGRALSNQLLTCLETVLPAAVWPRLARLAVATGPGGFTGTRLTIVVARTLAQQLAVPLDGISSFRLIARRLHRQGAAPARGPFWLLQDLPRHGQVAGLYAADPQALGGIAEALPPCLYRQNRDLDAAAERAGAVAAPRCAAVPELPQDAAELLVFGQDAARRRLSAPWAPVLPLYPTSPVGTGV
ncbi:tRNA (adenosine(37)-N6)-threonylcarbamoyltransferase complex dimerization subunit type 1 TsaB [Cyanobium sp. FGCU-6]|nr:tRNA (adenosine(37)-N6)-threonylcarbamoyltransferase complex dimerization subunit type 1 TsaB [Cyanobium sp. FGCU6]